jgi:hypothetical protein
MTNPNFLDPFIGLTLSPRQQCTLNLNFSEYKKVFTGVGTYVQRGSKFCFVLLVGVIDIA